MRKLLIIIITVIFFVYCFKAYESKHMYDLPDYTVEKVDILGGASLKHWNSEHWATKRYDRLSTLEGRQYQMPDSDKVLRTDDFKKLVAEGTTSLELRNPAAITSFVEKGLHLREDVSVTRDGEKILLAEEGSRLEKGLIDKLLSAGIKEVPVVGQGDVVGANATIFMVILIFIGMALALEDIFWKPVMQLVDKRRNEIEAGVESMRSNKTEHQKIETDRLEKMREVRSEYQDVLYKERKKAMVEADKLLTEANKEVRLIRDKAAEDLSKAVKEAEDSLRKEIPALTELVTDVVTGKKG